MKSMVGTKSGEQKTSEISPYPQSGGSYVFSQRFERHVLENETISRKTRRYDKKPDGGPLRHNDVIRESSSLHIHFSLLLVSLGSLAPFSS